MVTTQTILHQVSPPGLEPSQNLLSTDTKLVSDGYSSSAGWKMSGHLPMVIRWTVHGIFFPRMFLNPPYVTQSYVTYCYITYYVTICYIRVTLHWPCQINSPDTHVPSRLWWGQVLEHESKKTFSYEQFKQSVLETQHSRYDKISFFPGNPILPSFPQRYSHVISTLIWTLPISGELIRPVGLPEHTLMHLSYL